MPHVIVKMNKGRSEADKRKLAQEITKAVMNVAKTEESAISVSIEDIEPGHWLEEVYKPDILSKWDDLYQKPGYDPL